MDILPSFPSFHTITPYGRTNSNCSKLFASFTGVSTGSAPCCRHFRPSSKLVSAILYRRRWRRWRRLLLLKLRGRPRRLGVDETGTIWEQSAASAVSAGGPRRPSCSGPARPRWTRPYGWVAQIVWEGAVVARQKAVVVGANVGRHCHLRCSPLIPGWR